MIAGALRSPLPESRRASPLSLRWTARLTGSGKTLLVLRPT